MQYSRKIEQGVEMGMYKVRHSGPLYSAPNRFNSRLWYYLIDPDFGRCATTHMPKDGETFVRVRVMKPKDAPRYLGRRSYRKQPKRWMKFGWYAEYMEREWGAPKQHYGCINDKLRRRFR